MTFSFAKMQCYSVYKHVLDAEYYFYLLIDFSFSERSLEDHEYVLTVYSSWGPQSDKGNKFIFKQDFCKYEFFRTPQVFYNILHRSHVSLVKFQITLLISI